MVALWLEICDEKWKMKGIYIEETARKTKGHFGSSNQPLEVWHVSLLH